MARRYATLTPEEKRPSLCALVVVRKALTTLFLCLALQCVPPAHPSRELIPILRKTGRLTVPCPKAEQSTRNASPACRCSKCLAKPYILTCGIRTLFCALPSKPFYHWTVRFSWSGVQSRPAVLEAPDTTLPLVQSRTSPRDAFLLCGGWH